MMRDRIRASVSYANAMSTLAVFGMLATGSAFAASQIGTNDIKNGAVTARKLHKNAVTTQKIKDGAVTGAKVANNSLTTQKIKVGAVTGSKVANNSLTGAQINAATLGTVPNATRAASAGSATSATSADHATNADQLSGSPPSAFLGQTITVTKSKSVSANAIVTDFSQCPNGHEAVGGGAYATVGGSSPAVISMLGSAPATNGIPVADGTGGPADSWVTGVQNDRNAIAVTVHWSVVCAKEGP
jgi:hypothetical protein